LGSLAPSIKVPLLFSSSPDLTANVINYPFFSLLSLFWKNKSKLMRSRCCPCVYVCVSPLSLLGNGSVKIPLSLLGNGSVKVPLSLLGNGSVKIPLLLLGNGSVKISLSLLGNGSLKVPLSSVSSGSVEALPRQRIHT
jgi:hypothetical protein